MQSCGPPGIEFETNGLRYVRVRCVFCSLCVVDIYTMCWVTLAATLVIHFHYK